MDQFTSNQNQNNLPLVLHISSKKNNFLIYCLF